MEFEIWLFFLSPEPPPPKFMFRNKTKYFCSDSMMKYALREGGRCGQGGMTGTEKITISRIPSHPAQG